MKMMLQYSNKLNSNIGKIYIVATPIGNLKDITYRAVEVLSFVDIILCEDTRNSIKLLEHYNIQKKLISYHKYSDKSRDDLIYNLLLEGKNVALISDAGTPMIADPGTRLVKFLSEKGIKVNSIPGACSVINSLILAGVDTSNFYFAGWMSKKNSQKSADLVKFFEITDVIVFLESPHRIQKSINVLFDDIKNNFEKFNVLLNNEMLNNSDNPQEYKKNQKILKQKENSILNPKNVNVYIVREMTKIFEEVIKGNLEEVNDILNNRQNIKGEMVLIFEKNKEY